jgi:TonB family protein
MTRNVLLVLALGFGFCCLANPVAADSTGSRAAAGQKTVAPPPPPPPPPPEEPPILYDSPPPAPPRPPGPPPGYVPLEPIDRSKPQADPSTGVQEPPEFPEDEMCRGIGGTTELLLDYDKLGHVVEVGVRKSSGSRSLDRAAVDAARGWRITPGLRNGFPVAGKVAVPVEFKPEGGGGWWCDSALRIEQVRFGRKVQEAGEDRIENTRSLSANDVALLQVGYIAIEGRAPASIEVDWYRDGGSNDPIYHHTSKPLEPGTNSYEFRLAYTNGWRPGNYIAVVRVNGLARRKLQFSVAGDALFPTVTPAPMR